MRIRPAPPRPATVPLEAFWNDVEGQWQLGRCQDGVCVGHWRTWRPDGTRLTSCWRDDRGWLDGQLERYHPDGGLAERSEWADDQPHGIMERFHASGELARRIPWVRGVIDGVAVWAYPSAGRPEPGPEAPRRIEVRYRDGAPAEADVVVAARAPGDAAEPATEPDVEPADDEPGDDEPDADDETPAPTEPPPELQAHLAALAALAATDPTIAESLATFRKLVARGLGLTEHPADRERGLDDRAVEQLRARAGAAFQVAMIAVVRHGATYAAFDYRRRWTDALLAPIVRIGGGAAADVLVDLLHHDPTATVALDGLVRLGDDRVDDLVVQVAEACLGEPWLYDGMACHARFFAAMDAARARHHPHRPELVRRALGGDRRPWPWTWVRWALDELIATRDATAASDLEAAFHRWVDFPGDRWTARTSGQLLAGLAGCALAACDPARARGVLGGRWSALVAAGRHWDRAGKADVAVADRDAYAFAVLVGGLLAIEPHHDDHRACARYQLAYRGTGRLADRDPITSFNRSTLEQEHLVPVQLALTGLALGAAAASADHRAEAIASVEPFLLCGLGRSYQDDPPYQRLRDQASQVIAALGGTPRRPRTVTRAWLDELARQGREALLAALADPTVAGKHHLVPGLDAFADAETTRALGEALLAETPYTAACEPMPYVEALVTSLGRRPGAAPYLEALATNPHVAPALRQAARAVSRA